MKKKKGTHITVRPDEIVEARYSLSSSQNSIIDIFLTSIDDDPNTTSYTLEIKKYAQLFPSGTSNAYRDLKEAVNSFRDSGFEIRTGPTRGLYVQWFSSIAWDDETKTIELEVGKNLKQLFLTMRQAIFFPVKNSLALESAYSKRIYYFCQKWAYRGVRYDMLDELKAKLDTPPSYEKYSLFKRRVLEIATREINEKTDLRISYDEIKSKNKVIKIKFTIQRKDNYYSDKHTKLNLTDMEYDTLVSVANNYIGENEKGYSGEEYLLSCIDQVRPEKIEKNKMNYMLAVLSNEQNQKNYRAAVDMQAQKIEMREAAILKVEEIEKADQEEMQEKVEAFREKHPEIDTMDRTSFWKSLVGTDYDDYEPETN